MSALRVHSCLASVSQTPQFSRGTRYCRGAELRCVKPARMSVSLIQPDRQAVKLPLLGAQPGRSSPRLFAGANSSAARQVQVRVGPRSGVGSGEVGGPKPSWGEVCSHAIATAIGYTIFFTAWGTLLYTIFSLGGPPFWVQWARLDAQANEFQALCARTEANYELGMPKVRGMGEMSDGLEGTSSGQATAALKKQSDSAGH